MEMRRRWNNKTICMNDKIIPTEYEECLALVDYLNLKKIKHTHIASETYTTSWNQKRKNKASGVQKGFPDYVLFIDAYQSAVNYPILVLIEMKRQKLSHTSPEQLEWITALNKVKNVQAHICKGFHEARQVIDKYVI